MTNKEENLLSENQTPQDNSELLDKSHSAVEISPVENNQSFNSTFEDDNFHKPKKAGEEI